MVAFLVFHFVDPFSATLCYEISFDASQLDAADLINITTQARSFGF